MEVTNQHHPTQLETDVVVIGGGLAGMAVANHLARAGLRVLCLEPRESFPNIVGESLDWSAPHLLDNLGLPMQRLVETGAATFKRHITITAADGATREYLPGTWLAHPLWNVELRTLHVDRQPIHRLLQDSAQQLGVTTLRERAVGFELRHRRIVAVQTSAGSSIRAAFTVDASGAAASMLARQFHVRSTAYGPRKVALWAHIPTEDWVEGTTLYPLSEAGEYMEWMWEIPIRPGVSSIGYVAPGSSIKLQRTRGLTNAELLSRHMQRFARLRALVRHASPERVASTTFLCRTFKGVCGTNWIIIGEAASQSDPITGNGVTAALRHAAEASALIRRYRHRHSIPLLARAAYNLRVSGMGCYFNSLIEKLYYQSPLRAQLGLFGAAEAYTVPAWLTNLVYARTRPKRLAGTLALCAAMLTVRAAGWGLFHICRLWAGRRARSPRAVRHAGLHAVPAALTAPPAATERREQRRALHLQR